MSTFYLVLYIFIAVILLLCVVSFCMYLLHICGGMFESNKNRGFIISRATTYAPEEQQLLNQTQLTHISEENESQVALVNVKQRIGQLNHLETSQHQTPTSTVYQQLASQNQTPFVTQNVQREPVKTPVALPGRPLSDYKANTVKPAISVKPMIHSLSSSKRNSIVKPTDAPPPPPPPQANPVPVGGGTKSNRGPLAMKPKAPPPPPPSVAATELPLPPCKDVLYDTPQTGGDNYLSDNE